MNCRFCGTALPADALFCGECGRAVEAALAAPRVRETVPPATATLSFSSPGSLAEPASRPFPTADSEYSCPQCGEPIDEDDVFCGECGFVLAVSGPRPDLSTLPSPEEADDEQDAFEEAEPPPVAPAPEPTPAPVVDAYMSMFAPRPGTVRPEPLVAPVEPTLVFEEPVPDPRLDEPAPVVTLEPEPEPEPVDLAEPEPEPADIPPPAVPAVSAPTPRTPLRPVPDPFPWGKDLREATVDLEATRIVAGPSPEERFVLQFSTGESVTVTGAGLVGRNPASQPGEFVDQLVTIFDAGKSVSKTHLEFGQDSGRFWVSDRYSTNGSTVRQPDVEPKRCEPGRRYFVARGTRVDIGEQFFVVS